MIVHLKGNYNTILELGKFKSWFTLNKIIPKVWHKQFNRGGGHAAPFATKL